MTTTSYTAEVTDPITGHTVTVAAATAAELEQLIDQALAIDYPDVDEHRPG